MYTHRKAFQAFSMRIYVYSKIFDKIYINIYFFVKPKKFFVPKKTRGLNTQFYFNIVFVCVTSTRESTTQHKIYENRTTNNMCY